MANNNASQAVAELRQTLLTEGIVDPVLFPVLEDVENTNKLKYLDATMERYFRNANDNLDWVKRELEALNPEYVFIDRILEIFRRDSLCIAATKVANAIDVLRDCLSGNPDVEVVKSTCRSLEHEYITFETKLRIFLELKKQE